MPNTLQSPHRLRSVLEVPLPLRAELDRGSMIFRELLALSAGDTIRLSRPEDRNTELYIGEALIGWGEVSTIDRNIAVRIAHLKEEGGAAHASMLGDEEEVAQPSGVLTWGSLKIMMTQRTLPSSVGADQTQFASRISAATAPEPSNENESPDGKLLELELPISIVLGRAELPIRDALRLSTGALVELDRRVGDPVELVVRNVVVGRAEVVLVEGNIGICLLETISPKERIALRSHATWRTRQRRIENGRPSISACPTLQQRSGSDPQGPVVSRD